MRSFEDILRDLEQLKSNETIVNLGNCLLDSTQAIQVTNVLAENSSIRSLNVSRGNLDDDAAQALGELTQLRHLNLAHNGFTDKGIRKILTLNTRLTALDASYNNLTADEARSLLNLPNLSVKITMDNFSQAALSSSTSSSAYPTARGYPANMTEAQWQTVKDISENTACVHAHLTPAVIALGDVVTPKTP